MYNGTQDKNIKLNNTKFLFRLMKQKVDLQKEKFELESTWAWLSCRRHERCWVEFIEQTLQTLVSGVN